MAAFPKHGASRQGVTQALAVGATSVQLTNKFGTETWQIRLASTTGCYFLITENAAPVAATAANGSYLPPNWVDYIIVTPGETLTVIEASAAGTLTVTEMS